MQRPLVGPVFLYISLVATVSHLDLLWAAHFRLCSHICIDFHDGIGCLVGSSGRVTVVKQDSPTTAAEEFLTLWKQNEKKTLHTL